MSNKGYSGDRAFEFLCGCARRGERAPFGDTVPGGVAVYSVLAKLGRIRVEVFAKNFRQITILEGADKGLKTMDPPSRSDGSRPEPYLVNDKTGLRRNGKIVEPPSAIRGRPQPSAPRMIQIGKVKP